MIRKYFPFKENWRGEFWSTSLLGDGLVVENESSGTLDCGDEKGARPEHLRELMSQFDGLVMEEIKVQKKQRYKVMFRNPRNRHYLFYIFWYCVLFVWLASVIFFVVYVVAEDNDQFGTSIGKKTFLSYHGIMMLISNCLEKITGLLCILMIQEKYMIGEKL